ncbi:putative ribonuclease H-like domain-containing protein [Tanacetum coccineum]
MELENSQNNALAKLPMLKLGEYEMWEIRIKQYFQIQDYALWEVIENGNSWVPIPVTAPESGPSTALKMTVPSTAEEKICKKNDVKARSLLLMALPNEHQLTFETRCFKKLCENVSTAIKWDILPENAEHQKVKTTEIGISTHKGVTGLRCSEKAMCAIDGAGFDWSDMAEEEIQANMALMAFTDSEEIALLKRSVGHKEYLMGLLRTELEKVKEEKEGFKFKIAKFEKSSKDLDQLLASQITDKSKKGFGYNVVPSPHPLILKRPTPLDLSYSGLEEFKQPEVNEYGPRDSSVKSTTGCDKESDNSKENTDDSLKQQQKTDSKTSSLKVDKDWKENFFYPANQVREEAPKKARENNDAPIIEDWVSDDEDDVEPIPKVEKKTVIPTATKKEFVKPEKPVRRSVRHVLSVEVLITFNTCPNVHKHMVPRAVLMKTGLKTVNNARPVNTVRPLNGGYVYCLVRSKVGKIYCKVFLKDGGTFSSMQSANNSEESCSGIEGCKQHRASCKTKAFNPITKSLFMLHMDLFGLTFVSSLMHKKYCLVVTDDYSRFSWVFFLTTKDETSEILKNFIKEVENLVDKKVKIIRSDNGIEFKNKVIDEFCREKGIEREYSVARTPQQNGVAERKNRTLIEAARTMLVKPHNKTPYELFRGIKPAIGFMKPFGCHVTILNTLDKLGKFDGKSDEGFFVGYSLSSKAFRVYNIRTRKVQENLHIGFLENKPMIEGNGPKWLFDLDSLTKSMNYVPVVAVTFSNDFSGIQGVSESSTSS